MLPAFKGLKGQQGRANGQVLTGVTCLWREAQGTPEHLTGSLILLL